MAIHSLDRLLGSPTCRALSLRSMKGVLLPRGMKLPTSAVSPSSQAACRQQPGHVSQKA